MAVNNSIIKQSEKSQTLKAYVNAMQGEIAKALPSVITPERFTRMALSAISNNSKLQECSPQSFLGAMMNAAQLGLEPNTPTGQAYLIPYGNQVQFQIGYAGLITLAYRNPEMQNVNAQVVYENDKFEYELGLEPKLVHKPAKSNRGEIAYFYATYKLKNGGYGFEVMSKEDVDAHAKQFSKTFDNGPWQTNYIEMAKKTVLKKVLKYAPLQSDFIKNVAEDESIKSSISDDMSTIKNEIFEVEVNEVTGEVKQNNKQENSLL